MYVLLLLGLFHFAASHVVDVAIIGGGLSGLGAAKDLSRAGKSFVVLEARDGVGGRVLNHHLKNGGITEAGAEFVGPTQDRVLALARELGLETFATYGDGNSTLYRNGTIITYDSRVSAGGLPAVADEAIPELAVAIATLDEMAAGIDPNSPWSHPNAMEWDRVTMATWIEKQVSHADASFLLNVMVREVLSCETSEPSLLYVVAYVASSGNETAQGSVERLIATRGGAQQDRIVGGTQLLAINLSRKLGWANIHLNTAVRRIGQQRGHYRVVADREVVLARHVVVAMSPPMASRIVYDPPLPAGRDQLTQRMPMGSLAKATAIYETPFWREMGLNAQALSDSGMTRSLFDNSPPDGSFGAIMGFIQADETRKADSLSEEELQAIVLQDLVNYFGPRAANVVEWSIQRWDMEEYSRGAPVAYAPPGVLTRYGVYLSAPVGKIHFAGTETSPYWTGYMDGAVRSGERVAKEILNNF